VVLVSARTVVLIPEDIYKTIVNWAKTAYPYEGCGLLIGRFKNNSKEKEVVRFTSIKNVLAKGSGFIDMAGKNLPANDPQLLKLRDERLSTLPLERRSRPEIGFGMDPAQFNLETLQAEQQGLDIVGIVHTHPDHPPRPSSIDSAQPFLAQWSNIIVAVSKGKTKEGLITQMKSWFRERDDQPFQEEDIKIR
jgi:proteasome lid subunit RPN8/RPN11